MLILGRFQSRSTTYERAHVGWNLLNLASTLYHDSHFVLNDFFEIYRERHSPLALNKLRLLQIANAYCTKSLARRLAQGTQKLPL